MRWPRLLLAFLALCCAGAGARAEERVVKPAPPAVAVRLGASAVDLTGPWRFHVDDDARWSQAGFDDSGWELVDLQVPGGSDGGDLVPGWTAQGHPHHAGFAWYRLRVDVQDAQNALSLRMPGAVDDAYQIFVNGHENRAVWRLRTQKRSRVCSTAPGICSAEGFAQRADGDRDSRVDGQRNAVHRARGRWPARCPDPGTGSNGRRAGAAGLG